MPQLNYNWRESHLKSSLTQSTRLTDSQRSIKRQLLYQFAMLNFYVYLLLLNENDNLRNINAGCNTAQVGYMQYVIEARVSYRAIS